MSWRRIPLVPTLLVLAAAAVMVWLGFWQLGKVAPKEAAIAEYTKAQADPVAEPWPGSDILPYSYSKVQTECLTVLDSGAKAGKNAKGRLGWVKYVRCKIAGGGEAEIVLGWSSDPAITVWNGGVVTGTILERKPADWTIVADPPLAGLEANARPDPREIPNNHFSYAVQWFLFALTALVIYALALRKRLAGQDRGG